MFYDTPSQSTDELSKCRQELADVRLQLDSARQQLLDSQFTILALCTEVVLKKAQLESCRKLLLDEVERYYADLAKRNSSATII